MRVLAVVRWPCGGIRTYLQYTYARMPRGYEFDLIGVRSPEFDLVREHLNGRIGRALAVPERRCFVKLTRAVSAHLKGLPYDLVHSHGFTSGAAVAFANMPWRIPHVLTSHDVLRPEQFSGPTGWLKRRAFARLLSHTDVIQSVSLDASANLRAWLGSWPDRCVLTSTLNGIDVEHFAKGTSKAPGRLRSQVGVSEQTHLLGFFGRLMPQKGFDVLIEAVGMLKHLAHPFRIIVSNDGCYIREYRKQIAALGLERFFHFSGFTPDTAPLLHELDAVIMPSRWEACGILAMEALTAGCPLVASTCHGLREVIECSPAVAVAPGDAIELADAIVYMLEHRLEARGAARAYKPIARERFDAQRVADELDTLFLQATARPRFGGS